MNNGNYYRNTECARVHTLGPPRVEKIHENILHISRDVFPVLRAASQEEQYIVFTSMFYIPSYTWWFYE